MSDTYTELKTIIKDLLNVDEAKITMKRASARNSKPTRSTWLN